MLHSISKLPNMTKTQTQLLLLVWAMGWRVGAWMICGALKFYYFFPPHESWGLLESFVSVTNQSCL